MARLILEALFISLSLLGWVIFWFILFKNRASRLFVKDNTVAFSRHNAEAVQFILEARRVHQEWADRLARGDVHLIKPTQVSAQEIGGNEEWHRLWVERYNQVLRALEKEK